MARWRTIRGLLVSGFFFLSAFAHSVLGGSAMRQEMAKAQVPSDLATSLTMGWYLGGAAQLVFGAIVLWTFGNAYRSRPVALIPSRMIALGYLAFGLVAFVLSGSEAFFLIMFATPGVLLGLAATGRAPKG